MTVDQFSQLESLVSAAGVVLCFALGYIGGYMQ